MRARRTESEERKMTIIYATHIFDGLEDWMTHLLYLCNGTIQRAMLRRVACSLARAHRAN